MSEELRAAILLLLDDRYRADPAHTVDDTDIAATLGIDIPEVRRQLDILVDQGLTREANTHGGHSAWISARGIAAVEQIRLRTQQGSPMAGSPIRATASPALKLFVSHSARDQAIATGLIELLRSALTLAVADIRCTSVDGYRLPVGADTDEHLRRELLEASSFVGIVSEASISSAYVLFELGARWGAGRHLAPVLAPGAPVTLLRGPLAGLNALRCDDENQLHQLVSDIGAVLRMTPQPVAAYRSALLNLLHQAPSSLSAQATTMNPQTPPQQALTSEGLDWAPVNLDMQEGGLSRAVYVVKATTDLPQPLTVIVQCSDSIDQVEAQMADAGPQVSGQNRVVIGPPGSNSVEITIRYPKLRDPAKLMIVLARNAGGFAVESIKRARE